MNQGQNILCSCNAQTVQSCDQGLQYCKNKSTLEGFLQQAFNFADRCWYKSNINKIRNTYSKELHSSHWVIPTQMGECFKFLPGGVACSGHQPCCRLVRVLWGCSTHVCRGFYCFWPHLCAWFWLSTLEVVEFLILIQMLHSELQPCAEWSPVCKPLLRFQFLSKTRKSWKY